MSYDLKEYSPDAQLKIAAVIAAGGVEDFDGKNCDNCSGWDGVSHRCNCGNRRMSWYEYTNRDGTVSISAEAY